MSKNRKISEDGNQKVEQHIGEPVKSNGGRWGKPPDTSSLS